MRKRIFENISANFIIKMIMYVFSFAETMYVTRIFLPELYGRASYALTVAGYFVMFARLGMPIYAVRTCAEKRNDPEALNRTFNELWSAGLVTSALSALVFLIAVFAVPSLRQNSALFLIAGCSVLLEAFDCEWLYRGLEKFRLLALISLCCKAACFFCCVLFLRSRQDLLKFACFSVLGSCGSFLICFFLRGKMVTGPLRFSLKTEHFKPILVFFMMNCAVTIYANFDLVMLGAMKTETEVGLYTIAAKAKAVLAITSGLVSNSLLPVASGLWRDGERERFRSLSAKTVVTVGAVQTCVAAAAFVFAKQIILILGGSDFLGAVPAFRMLLLSIPPIAASNILGGQVLIPAGQEKKLLRAEIAGAVFNLLANLIAIPRYSIVGAAFTTVVSEVIVWLLCAYYCQKTIGMDLGPSLNFKALRRLKTEAVRGVRILISRLFGNRLPYYCPCCDTRLRRFSEGGFAYRPERYDPRRYAETEQRVICPVCGSLPRHRILADRFGAEPELTAGKKILYFAPEASLMRWFRAHKIECTTADLVKKADLKLDIEQTGLPEDAYDLIVCNHVLEHVAHYEKALRELYRITRPGGTVLLSFPVDLSLDTVYEDASLITEAERVSHFGKSDHLRVFGKDTRRLLEKAGFRVSEISGEACDPAIGPVTGPADYDINVLWRLTK